MFVGKRDENIYNNEAQANGQKQGFFASLENLSNNLLSYVTDEDPNNNQEDQLH